MSSKLYKPIRVGDMDLKHRVVMAPLTRFRADGAHVPQSIVVEHYRQRASTPGTLLVSEATIINRHAGGYDHVPGIYTDDQIASWKKASPVTDAVHKEGSYIYLQLWALGRAAQVSVLEKEGGLPYVSASNIPLSDHPVTDPKPRGLEISEIKEYITYYAAAARNAVHRAGFDGVEVHGANGYLLDQFAQTVSNDRTDEYGGTPEKRVRFELEVVKAVVDAVGETKVGLRISPWNPFQDMREPDPAPTFKTLVRLLREKHPNLAYLHVVEPRADAFDVLSEEETPADRKALSAELRRIWGSGDGEGQPRFLSAGGYTKSLAEDAADRNDDIVVFGRLFIANPDLPIRLKNNIELNKGNRDTYYIPGSQSPEGYTDYPFATEQSNESRL